MAIAPHVYTTFAVHTHHSDHQICGLAKAEMVQVVRYLAGNRHLCLPAIWPNDWCP